MKKTYLILTIVGTLLPSIFVLKESLATGNILLYTQPLRTLEGMFANDISSAFMMDLLFVLALFLVWSYREAKRQQIAGLGWIWAYTFAFGLAGGLPLFLYARESAKGQEN
ncbi:MAG: DUF2834 domain-containing protein [Bacteroidota bacterium]